MSDTEKNSQDHNVLNMDFRMTTLIPFLVFCLCMSKIFFIEVTVLPLSVSQSTALCDRQRTN